jgi:hypothetical protein
MSDFMKLKSADFWKGLIVAVLTVLVASVGQIVQGWITVPSTFPQFDHVSMMLSLKAAVATALAYLMKNFFTDSVAAAKKTLAKAEEEENS